MTTLIIGAVVSIVAAFVLTLVDAAIGSASRVAADEAEAEGRRGASALRTILADSAGPISVLAFLRAIAEATAAVLITLVVVEQAERTWVALLISTAIMVVVTFVLVGVSPRTLGRQHSTAIALASAPFVVGVRRVLGPVARLLVTFGNAVTPGRGYRDGPFRSEAELRDLLDLAGESSIIEDEERDMLHSVFELGDTLAREVMVPRTDMITIESDKPARKALNLFIRSGFSRVPVVGSPVMTSSACSTSRTSCGACSPTRRDATCPSRTSCGRPPSSPRASPSTSCCATCSATRSTRRSSSTSTAARPAW